MRGFRVEEIARIEFDEAAAWYENERPGLGEEFIVEVDRVLERIETRETFATSPVAAIEGGVIRREFVKRFPYLVVFVETDDVRRVIMIRRDNTDPALWQSRLP